MLKGYVAMTNKQCFFISPIGDENTDIRKNSDTVLKFFLKPVCETFNLDVVRSDQEAQVEKIDHSVLEHLKNDELVICDLTGKNPNVFYEFGFRQALGLPLIPIITKGETIPMDVASLRTISYVTNDLNQQDAIKARLTESINAFELGKMSSNSEPQTSANQEPSALSQSLLSIQDKLDELKDLLIKKNDREIEQIADQVAKHAQPATSDTSSIMQTLLPLMMKNPDSLLKLKEITDKINESEN